jgi:hypothetical protein
LEIRYNGCFRNSRTFCALSSKSEQYPNKLVYPGTTPVFEKARPGSTATKVV